MGDEFRVECIHHANDRERLTVTGNKDHYPARIQLPRTAYRHIKVTMRGGKTDLDRKEAAKFAPVFGDLLPVD